MLSFPMVAFSAGGVIHMASLDRCQGRSFRFHWGEIIAARSVPTGQSAAGVMTQRASRVLPLAYSIKYPQEKATPAA